MWINVILTENAEIDALDEGYRGGGIVGLAAYVGLVVGRVDEEGQLARHRVVARSRRACHLRYARGEKKDEYLNTPRVCFFATHHLC